MIQVKDCATGSGKVPTLPKKILVSYTIKKIYKISIRVRAHMSESKVVLFSLIQKCTWKVPTIPFFQVCEIITCPLAPKLNLSEGKNNV